MICDIEKRESEAESSPVIAHGPDYTPTYYLCQEAYADENCTLISYRYLVEIYSNDTNFHCFADLTVGVPSRTALDRVVKESLGADKYISALWLQIEDPTEEF